MAELIATSTVNEQSDQKLLEPLWSFARRELIASEFTWLCDNQDALQERLDHDLFWALLEADYDNPR